MTSHHLCAHAASGCNYPEGECLGLCSWINWTGGECPLLPEILVEYKMRGGLVSMRGTPAGELRWGHTGTAGDVVAYRQK